MTNSTPASLLEKLRQPGETAAWERFVKLYTPLLFHWANRAGLPGPDAADLVQEVFLVLVQKLPEFEYDRQRSFRAWLRTILLNKWRNRLRQVRVRSLTDDEAPEPADAADLADIEEADYRRYLVTRAMELMQTDFQPKTWKAFWECQVAGRPIPEVAAELSLKPGAVRAAKFRVLCRLRQELDGLFD